MTSINIHNYEAYLLDYVEGNLKAEDVAELMLFMEQNPSLKSELEDLDLPEISASVEVGYMDKDTLKKIDINQGVTLTNVEDHMIASVEGLLNPQAQDELDTFITKSPELDKDMKLYQKVNVKPNEEIKYQDKEDLKRTVPFMRPIYYYASVAAVFLVMVMFAFLDTTEENNILAAIETPVHETPHEIPATNKEVPKIPPIEESENPVLTSAAGRRKAKVSETPIIIQQNRTPKITEEDITQEMLIDTDTEKDISVEPPEGQQIEDNTTAETIIPAVNEVLTASNNTVAVKADPTLIAQSQNQTVGEYLGKRIKKRILKRESVDNGQLDRSDMTEGIARGIASVTGNSFSAKRNTDEDTGTKSFSFKIGGFGYSRVRNN